MPLVDSGSAWSRWATKKGGGQAFNVDAGEFSSECIFAYPQCAKYLNPAQLLSTYPACEITCDIESLPVFAGSFNIFT